MYADFTLCTCFCRNQMHVDAHVGRVGLEFTSVYYDVLDVWCPHLLVLEGSILVWSGPRMRASEC